MKTAIAAIIVFGIIVFIHELGHFAVAKRVGILTREFAIGFGPKLFSVKKGETRYTIRALPLGGFVKMAGEDAEAYEIKTGLYVGYELNDAGEITKLVVNPETPLEHVGVIENFDLEKDLFIDLINVEERSRLKFNDKAMIIRGNSEMQIAPLNRKFNGKSVGERAATIFAGPLMNFILAGFLFALIINITGLPSNTNTIGSVVAGNPAAEAGIMAGDKIIAIDGQLIKDWPELAQIVANKANQKITVEISRDGQSQVTELIVADQSGVGKIGIMQSREPVGIKSLPLGFQQTYTYTKLIILSLGEMITGKVEADVAGPVGIIQLIGDQANEGLLNLINLSAFLSLNLGIINLLPLPALDGGRLVFIGLEAVRGRPVDPNKEGLVHFLGFAFLMMLILVVTYNDVLRIFN